MGGGSTVDAYAAPPTPCDPGYDHVWGDATGLPVPSHPAALIAAGPDFLTHAFRTFGWLSGDNRVTEIVRAEPCKIGSTGEKLYLSVAYARPGPETALFAKFSRNFDDAVRDRRKAELAPEIALAALSRVADLGIAVPQAVFADVEAASDTGLLITCEIPFGQGSVEPLHHKCMDHELDDPLEYYRVVVRALARLAAAHKSGALDPFVDRLFPYDTKAAAAEDPMPWRADEVLALVARYAAFAEACPQLLPPAVRAPAFLRRFADEAVRVAENTYAIKSHLQRDPAMIALSHFNAQIDNGWFWHDAAGALQCGLLDWQRARQMNVAYALWGALSGMGPDRFMDSLDAMLALFAGELSAHGGPAITVAHLREDMLLYAATMGLAGLIEAPAIVLSRLPEARAAADALDPVFATNETARAFLHVFTNFLMLWEAGDVSGVLDRLSK
jgi:hypothetical protein